jgi:excinuclease ABC subunit B
MANLDYHDPRPTLSRVREPELDDDEPASLHALVVELEKRMKAAAKALDFEEAARLRDRIRELRRRQLMTE